MGDTSGPRRRPQARVGRKRDASRDADILEATLEVLGEEGYEGMTMDKVAARAKASKATMYRRWPSKRDLVLEALMRMADQDTGQGELPDTGTLRGDFMAMIKPKTVAHEQHRLKVMSGLGSLISHELGLLEAANVAIVEPWARVSRTFMERAVARGEIPADADIDAIARVVPSMAAYRGLIERRPIDADFLREMIDGVLLPAAMGARK